MLPSVLKRLQRIDIGINSVTSFPWSTFCTAHTCATFQVVDAYVYDMKSWSSDVIYNWFKLLYWNAIMLSKTVIFDKRAHTAKKHDHFSKPCTLPRPLLTSLKETTGYAITSDPLIILSSFRANHSLTYSKTWEGQRKWLKKLKSIINFEQYSQTTSTIKQNK